LGVRRQVAESREQPQLNIGKKAAALHDVTENKGHTCREQKSLENLSN
jgi:hypothetical protein